VFKKFRKLKIVFHLFFSISTQECHHFIHQINNLKVIFSLFGLPTGGSPTIVLSIFISTHQAELIQISHKSSVSILINLVQDNIEESKFKAPIKPTSSPLVINISSGG
jgi:hypothetical protein